MKILKAVFYSIAALLLAGCAGVLVCAFNPSLTGSLAAKVNGAEAGVYGVSRAGINTGWMEGGDKVSYEIPDSRPENPPAAVSGKSGYQPVEEEGEEVSSEESANLPGRGDTGSGLSFDEEFYPYYAMLNSDMQQLYCQIYANAQQLAASFSPVVSVKVDQLKNVFEAVYNDHPQLFWLETGYSCKYLQDGSCVEIILKYNRTADNLSDAKQEFESYARGILSGAWALGSDAEMEQYVHDILMQMVEYDLRAPMNQSAYSALVQGRSVCAGYARAYQYLMQQLGIPCYYCTGYAGENHAWNIVRLDGVYYNVDVTWDDTEPATYDYFNKSDRQYASTHMRTGLSVYLPACVTDDESGEAAGEAAQSGEPGNSTAAEPVYKSVIADLINPSPMEPLTWQSRGQGSTPDDGAAGTATGEDSAQSKLDEAGITADEVRSTMSDYYEECEKLLEQIGVGDKQFSVVIPDSLWSTVEQAYINGDHWQNYVNDALEALGVQNFVIQLAPERLGGGYYRVYHNVYTF